jgi:hypothetical protein
MRWMVSILAALLGACAPCLAAPPSAHELALKRNGRLYLTSRSARLPLPILTDHSSSRADREFVLPDGNRYSVPTKDDGSVVVENGSGRISLPETLRSWVNDDGKWRDHEFKNYILGTYNHEHLTASLTDPLVFKGVLLAILTTHSVRGSGNNIKSQQLVRIDGAPTPHLTMLRWLEVPTGGPHTMPDPIRRMFAAGNRLLLFRNPVSPDYLDEFALGKPTPASELEEIDNAGMTLRVLGKIPGPIYPIGLVSDRWLVFGAARNTITRSLNRPIWLYDLKWNIIKPLPGNWAAYEGEWSVVLPETGSTMPYILLRKQGKDESEHGKLTAIHLPDGKRVSAFTVSSDAGNAHLWNGLLVVTDEANRSVLAYNVVTGKTVKRLRY